MTQDGGRWIKELDYMRAFAILGIVAIHVGSFSESIEGPSAIPYLTEYTAHLADFGVPLFFIVSGYILALKRSVAIDRGSFYRRRLMTVVPPYLAFTTIYLVYNYFALDQTDIYRAAWSYLLFDAVGVFWFLGALIQMYLLFPYLAGWTRRLEAKGQVWKLPVYSAVLYVAWYAFLMDWTAQAIGAVAEPVPGFGAIITGFLFPGYLLFFALGMYVAATPDRSGRTIRALGSAPMAAVMLLMPLGLQQIDSLFWWSVAVVPYSIVACALVLRLSRYLAARPGWATSIIEVVGRYAFGIYMAHILVMAMVVNRLWSVGLGADDLLFYLVLYAVTIAVCVIVLFIINLLPFGPLITGMRSRNGYKRARRRRDAVEDPHR
ncbi:MAG: acyltransferase [Methanomassiliicoccus sp.]|nr:acyltransferase [Methanomassiliicoccus sp.]